jgi:hypothetical protein
VAAQRKNIVPFPNPMFIFLLHWRSSSQGVQADAVSTTQESSGPKNNSDWSFEHDAQWHSDKLHLRTVSVPALASRLECGSVDCVLLCLYRTTAVPCLDFLNLNIIGERLKYRGRRGQGRFFRGYLSQEYFVVDLFHCNHQYERLVNWTSIL